MQIITENCSAIDKDNCKLNYIHIKITDIKNKAKELMITILDKSWLTKLDSEIDKASFIARSGPTIDLLIKLLKKVGDKIGMDFGEFLISSSALSVMENKYAHEKFPLAELWKEKDKGNPGFDFHTISGQELLFFGEAKYNSSHNAYPKAISQICSFIKKNKHIKELTDLKKINARVNDEHLNTGKIGFIAAFSIHNNFDNIFNTLMKNKNSKNNNIFKYPELYFIGIEVCPLEE